MKSLVLMMAFIVALPYGAHADERKRLAVVALDLDQAIIELQKIAKTADRDRPVRIRYRDNHTGQGIIDDLRRIQQGIEYAINERIELDNRPSPMNNSYSQR